MLGMTMTLEAPPTKTLNGRQIAFIDHYINLRNATKAALEAGYGQKNARQQGYELLQNPTIREEINRRLAQIAKKAGMTPEDITERLIDIVDSDKVKAGDKIQALGLLGRAQGMFKEDNNKGGGDVINIFAILPQLPPTRKTIEAVVTPSTVAIPSPLSTPSTDGIDKTIEAQAADKPKPAEGRSTPQPPFDHSNTPSPKFANQNPSVSQKGQSDDNNPRPAQ